MKTLQEHLTNVNEATGLKIYIFEFSYEDSVYVAANNLEEAISVLESHGSSTDDARAVYEHKSYKVVGKPGVISTTDYSELKKVM